MKQCLPLLPALLLAVGLAAPAAGAGSARKALPSPLPPAAEMLRSDAEGLSLVLRFAPDAFRSTDEGLYLELPGCALESADPGDPRAAGAPMLPVWRGLVALPPGMEARLDWRIVASAAVAGQPLPFPTPRAVPTGEDFLFNEELIPDATAFARAYPVAARLGEPHWLRDQRVVELVVMPLGFGPERGLTLATEMRVDLSFRAAAAGERAATASREAPRRPDRQWPRLYAGALLNAGPAASWCQRIPARFGVAAERGARAAAKLKLLTGEDGLYAVGGDSLIARGIPAGTLLADIALYRQRLDWDGGGQPVFSEIAEARYFLDADGDGALDPADRLVFLGWRQRHAPDSLDPIEWYGRESAYFVAVAPELASVMPTETAWSATGAWPQRPAFKRRLWQQGEQAFHQAPPNWFYNGVNVETWDDNLYYWALPLAPEGYVLRIPLATPAALADSVATLKLQFQGASRSALDGVRNFSVNLVSGAGGCTLPAVQVTFHNTIDYEATIPAGCLDPAGNTLVIDRTDGTQFRTYVKWYDLSYASAYAVREDSLFFHADGASGPAEIRVGGLTGDRSGWQLLRLAEGLLTRVTLAAENQAGAPGAYELRLRRDLAGDESWWLADATRLRAPAIATPADISVLAETSSRDVLVIAHDSFAAGMQRWIDRREDEGYAVRLLKASEVWDAFYGGVRGPIGLRNAARFAYQQWGCEALLLVGDASKDARGLSPDAMPDFLPVHSKHEYVGVDELVALEEWVVKWNWNDWPAMLMGRLPVGNAAELEIILDKMECFEGGCEPDGAWRRRFLLAADDCWVWDEPGDIVYCRDGERQFEIGVTAMRPLFDDSWVGDLAAVPYNLSAQTNAWYAEHSPVYPTELETLLRPIVSPVFIDSLSQGYLWASIQSHANRGQLCHELIFKTAAGGHDQDFLTNANRPFFWALFGCHGNEFAAYNEEKSNVGDCMGERLLFTNPPGFPNAGAVASYASDGFEYLFPNLRWQRDWHEIMVSATDPDGDIDVLPGWRAGELQLLAELRFGDREASYRTHLLGDPLLRLDAGAPRLRLFVNEQEMQPDDFVPPQVTGDTLRIEALVWDETYLAALSLSDSARAAIPFTAVPAFSAEASFPLDSLAPFDTTAVAATGRGRAWHLSARVPYNFGMDAVVLAARDIAGREAEFSLPVPKRVNFYLAGAPLRAGQWIRPSGTLRIDILVPSPEILPDRFALLIDGEPSSLGAAATDSTILHRMELPYAWAAGEHRLTVLLDGEEYGGIQLRVDNRTRLLAGRIFPNPFRNAVTFHFELTNGIREGTLSIYTLSGRRVFRRELGGLAEGTTQVVAWDGLDGTGSKIANGVYIARLALTDLSGEQVIWEDKVVRMR